MGKVGFSPHVISKSTFYNSYVSGLTTFFEQHSANRSLRDLKRLRLVQTETVSICWSRKSSHLRLCGFHHSNPWRCQGSRVAPSGRSCRSFCLRWHISVTGSAPRWSADAPVLGKVAVSSVRSGCSHPNPLIGLAARRGALPRERFRPLALFGLGVTSDLSP